MSMSFLYQVLEPLPDAVGALGRARELLGELGESACDPCPEVGTHAVYLSIGTRNRDIQDAWLRNTGLRLGPPLTGW